MAVSDFLYPSFKRDVTTGAIDLDNDTFGMLLVDNTYTPAAAHQKRSDITGEVSGTGYTAGGQALTGVTATLSGSTFTFDAADPTWANSTITAYGAIVYKRRGGAATADELVGCFSFGGVKSSSNGNFTVNVNVAGLVTF